jgi:hypothetical protein
MNLSIRAEDIMTPRRLLRHAKTEADAKKLADIELFDAVPLSGKNGVVREFWSRSDGQRSRISRRHSTSHDKGVETLLPALGSHIVQFVFYRSELVGLLDASDLNKPIACLAWLQPMLELERAILSVVADRNIDDHQQSVALGQQAKPTLRRQEKAKKHDLVLPLLEYAQFPSLLRASRNLNITSLSDDEISILNEVRRRAAHGAGDPVIQDRTDCMGLKEALELARKVASTITRRKAF